jgi:hypothetical protein
MITDIRTARLPMIFDNRQMIHHDVSEGEMEWNKSPGEEWVENSGLEVLLGPVRMRGSQGNLDLLGGNLPAGAEEIHSPSYLP